MNLKYCMKILYEMILKCTMEHSVNKLEPWGPGAFRAPCSSSMMGASSARTCSTGVMSAGRSCHHL